MKNFLKKYLIVLLSIHIFNLAFTSIIITKGLNGIVLASAFYCVFYFLIRPALKIILFPLNLLTLNLAQWILDIILFYIWTLVSPGVSIADFIFRSMTIGPISIGSFHLVYWQSVIVSAILLRLIIKTINWIIQVK